MHIKIIEISFLTLLLRKINSFGTLKGMGYQFQYILILGDSYYNNRFTFAISYSLFIYPILQKTQFAN